MRRLSLALVGNPNCGKSTLFNYLTGLHQKTGNFAGVTVEKVSGESKLDDQTIDLVDLPGTYSLHPLTEDEHVVLRTLIQVETAPDAIIYVADITQLERHLLLYSQIKDLGFPILLLLSMSDLAEKKQINVDLTALSEHLNQHIVPYGIRSDESLATVKKEILNFLKDLSPSNPTFKPTEDESRLIQQIDQHETAYGNLLLWYHGQAFLEGKELENIEAAKADSEVSDIALQVEETLARCQYIEHGLSTAYLKDNDYLTTKSYKWDRWLTHSIVGPLTFLFIMFMVFQAIFSLAQWPMEAIDWTFSQASGILDGALPAHWTTSFLSEGLVPGLAGVVIFIPQIAILFFLIGLLEESGYMSRAIFLFDRFFQRFGLNGRSLVALVSASACAIPAIMSARSIKNPKEKLITILVTPLMSCSARTPVYIVLIAFIVSSEKVWGWINLQGLVFIGFYMTGLLATLGLAWVLKKIFKSEGESFLMLELPEYKWPNLRSVFMHTWHKVKSFIIEAGKVIVVITIFLWFMASYGRSSINVDPNQQESIGFIQEAPLETSFAGELGKWIEPVIKPLGFDWKIGISLITSFAAREVFVSTMATLYSIGDEENYQGIQAQMKKEVHSDTLEPVYTQRTALSLVVFYIFAMQCMSTLAVVRKETGTWKWPIIQFLLMGILAYGCSFLIYQFWPI